MSVTTDTFDATQEAIVAADVQVTDASGNNSVVQAGMVDIPAGGACGGSGAGSITFSVGTQGQPLAGTLSGTCSDGSPLSLQQAAALCVTSAQYISTDEQLDNGSNLVLSDASGNALPAASGGSRQACGLVTSPGTYTVAVVVTSPPG